jgi:hypothetical protein
MICKIDNIYSIDTISRNDPYYIVIDEETYKICSYYNQPKSMKYITEHLLMEPSVTITIKKSKPILFMKGETFEIVDIRTDNLVYWDQDYVNSWLNHQRHMGSGAIIFLWISYTLIAGYIVIFYRCKVF